MDKRFYNLTDMLREAEGSTGCKNCGNAEAEVPDCIDTDFCGKAPEDMNSGILTMAFVDMQPLDSVYPPATAMERGTLFPNIDKPFFGGMTR